MELKYKFKYIILVLGLILKMEPNFNRKKNNTDDKFSESLSSKENKVNDRGNRILSLRKNKKMNIPIMKSDDEQIQEKYELSQNSFDSSNNIIQNFFSSQEKPKFLYQLISNNNFSSDNKGNYDLNLIKFIIVQCLNYYKSEKEKEENLDQFFTDTIITNLTDIMVLYKEDINIVGSIAGLLKNLSRYSENISKLITLNSSNLQKIFGILNFTNEEIASQILKLIYNCYITDEEAVNPTINIGVYVFESLNKFFTENNIDYINISKSPYIRILISFLNELINDNTKDIYKEFDSNKKNNIINTLLVLCRDAMDEDFKLDAHKGLIKLLEIIKSSEELNVEKFGICEIASTFVPHLRMESNSSDIVRYSLKIIDQFSYLCDNQELIKMDLINQIEQILLTIIDMYENRNNPKSYYKNFDKGNISKMLNSISFIISNATADYQYTESHNEWKEKIFYQTRIIDYLVICLKIKDLDEDDLSDIYDFFKDFLEDSDKQKLIKLILSNFIEIALVENLKDNIINKNFAIIEKILEISLMMLQITEKLSGNQNNFVKIYLEKKGFNEMLTNIVGINFGIGFNSEIARNIQEKFFK